MGSFYLERYAWKNPVFDQNYPGDPGLIVVIPAFDEIHLSDAISSLQACEPPQDEVLILVIINEPEHCDVSIHQVNQKVFDEVRMVKGQYPVLSGFLKLPDRKAGVGLARKIGMDEAVRIFEANERNGVIVCYDADCSCDSNYLVEIEKYFRLNEANTTLTFYEHPFEGENEEAIINYELYLRYYADALRWSGFPYAFQTLGSCISVRVDAYMKQGGMNARKAGEDFYFIHKMTSLGNISEINTTTVYPSDRLSARVPFGTGHAIGKYLESADPNYPVYAPSTFQDLKVFFGRLPDIYEAGNNSLDLPESILSFHEKSGFQDKLDELINQTSDYPSFRKRFFHWMDGLKVLQFVHHCRDCYYENVPLLQATNWLNNEYFHLQTELSDKKRTLEMIRAFDREHPFHTM